MMDRQVSRPGARIATASQKRECPVLDGFDASTARQNDPKRTRANILAAAQRVFADKGYSGANVNEIVALAGSTKPMIYYHFGSKEGLFAAVLEEVYAGMRQIEVTFDYHADHPDWIRLISVANIHGAQHITGSATIASRNAAVVEILRKLLERGVREGVFRPGVDPVHLHMLIASFCFYRVSNRHTWRIIFQDNLDALDDVAAQRAVVVEAALRYLRPEGA
jgi:AcrR family transcriptional regulator